MGFLDTPLIRRIRQNHALEHATMHLLARSGRPLRLVGATDWNGFTLYGEVETPLVSQAAMEALARLRAGEEGLAVHPRCGTNLAVIGLLTGIAAYLAGSWPAASRAQRWARITLALGAAVCLARPLGMPMQRHVTTSTALAGVRIRAIRREQLGRWTAHRILITAGH